MKEDFISRQAAIERATKEHDFFKGATNPNDKARRDELLNVMCWLGELPSQDHWVPVTERLPEEPFGCIVTVWDTDPISMIDFENILPYFVGWDGEQWNDGEGLQCPFEVIAWIPLPLPYKVSEEEC